MPKSIDLTSAGFLGIETHLPQLYISCYEHAPMLTRRLTLSVYGDPVVTLDGGYTQGGNQFVQINLTVAQAAALIAYVPANDTTLPVEVTATAWRGETQVGDPDTVTAILELTAAYSSPVINSFAYADVNLITLELTGNNRVLVTGQSVIAIYNINAEGRNGATIVSYAATLGSKTVKSTTNGIAFGTPETSYHKTLTVTVTDSRGFTASREETLTILPYAPISISKWEARRVNSVEETVTLSVRGIFSPLTLDGVDLNTLVTATYAYKLSTDADYGDEAVIEGLIISSTGFSLDSDSFITLDPEGSYDLRLTVRDKLTVKTLTIPIPKGRPLIALRNGMVGINKNDPVCALDVIGEIRMNGHKVLTELDVISEVPLVTISTPGTVKSSIKENRVKAAEDGSGELEVVSLNMRKLTQTEGDTIILRGKI